MKLYLNESDKNRLNEKVDKNVTYDFLDSHFYNNGTVDKKYLLDSIGMVIDNNKELYNNIANRRIKITAIVWEGFKELVNMEIKHSGYECDSEHLKKWLSLRFGVKGNEIYNVFEPLYKHYEKEREERLNENTKTGHTKITVYENTNENISLDEIIWCQEYANDVIKYCKGKLPRSHSDAESLAYDYNDNVRSFENEYGYPIDDYIEEIINEIGLIVESKLENTYENIKHSKKHKKFENTQINKNNIDKIIDVAESLDWSCDIDDDNGELLGIEFEKYSPAGEDFSFFARGNTAREIVESVDFYYENFDTDEHITMWVNAKISGVSSVPNIRVLVEDADAIDEMLKELSEALYNIDFDEEDED